MKKMADKTQNIRLYLDLQNTITAKNVPNQDALHLWAKSALLNNDHDEYELTLRIVDKDEIRSLNKDYRHKDKTTNVLSFPYEDFPISLPEDMVNDNNISLLGDIVICHDIVLQEAQQQNKSLEDHWAHLVVHGVLHLQAYDHIEEEEAQLMESLEVAILKKLNIANPYQA